METNSLLVVGLAMLCSGGLLYVFAYPYLSGDVKREKRQKALQAPTQARRPGLDRSVDQAKRRQQITDSLKEIDRAARRKRTLQDRFKQAGLDISLNQFIMASAACGLVIGGVVFLVSGDPMIAAGGALAGALGLPRWVLNFLFKRRIKQFMEEFPNAVDIIIRGVKAGLPLGQCMQVIAAETREPVRSEFRRIVESQALGMTVPESVERMTESMPVAEANFFSIVINLQAKSGGNLSEALSNLSRVLRDRKKMKMKIKAMSSEAKTSAGIIGAMPFVVAFFVWLTTPDYISILWTVNSGRVVLAICAFWMMIGIFIMRKLINFDF